MQRDIIQKWSLQHPVEQVWEHLTKPELIAEWLMENDFKPVVGHKFNFRAKPRIKIGFDGIVYCEVKEVVPNKRLSYTWRGGPGNGKIILDSVVTWTLTPTATGTDLLLEHTGFQGLKNLIAYFMIGRGWQGKIQERFNKLLNQQRHATAVK